MDGVQIKQAKEVRVFAHSAKTVIPGSTRIDNTENRGVCIYVGGSGNLKVTMEDGVDVEFKNVVQGTFLPILVTHVLSGTTATNLVALW
tara:strand:+ start:2172 stop:2438 length:267 start_codon:yes stop_codon:yes gene_type:complete